MTRNEPPVRAGQVYQCRTTGNGKHGRVFLVLGAATGMPPFFGEYAYVAYRRRDGTFGDEADARYKVGRFAVDAYMFTLVSEAPCE